MSAAISCPRTLNGSARRGRPLGGTALAIRSGVLDLTDRFERMTVLQVFYGLEVQGVVAKTEGGYRQVQAQVLRMRREVVGYVSQFLRVIPRVPALEIVATAARETGASAEAADRRARHLLERLNLPERLWAVPPATFSGGEQQRVNIARGFAADRPLLLLDEPTASLDPDIADWVRSRLEHYRDARGATMLIASHNMAEVERLCERVIFMKRGRIEDDDTPARLLARYGRDTLEEVFLDVARGRDREAAR